MHPNCIEDIKKICKRHQISFDEDLSYNFIRKFKIMISRRLVETCPSCNFNLSEEFIREFADVINWKCVSHRQELSEEFVREFQYKIDWKNLFENENLEATEAFYEEFKDKLNAS